MKNVMVYFRDKWRPAALVSVGRKWAKVQINGRARQSQVPVDAIREIQVPQPVAPDPSPATATPKRPELDGDYSLEVDSGYFKIRTPKRCVAIMPKAYKEEADVVLEALKSHRRALTKPSESAMLGAGDGI